MMKLLREIYKAEAAAADTDPIEYYVDAKNWPKDLDGAKAFAKQAWGKFKWKKKAAKFKDEIDRATTVARVQSLVINPLLSGEGNSVIK